MAVTRNLVTEADLVAAYTGQLFCWTAVYSDTDYIIDPDPIISGQEIPWVAGGTSLSSVGADDTKVEFWNGKVVTIPIGHLVSGRIYPLPIVKVFATGTLTPDILLWRGAALKNINPTGFLSL